MATAALDLGCCFDVSVVGLGYVGLPTAAMLASRGYTVAGVDRSHDVVSTVSAGQVHIVEPELDTAVRSTVEAGQLHAMQSPVRARTHLICVPTPVGRDHCPDLGHVEAATEGLASVVEPGNLVVLESTVPPGTTRDLVARILTERTGLKVGRDIFVAHAPERVLPGAVMREVLHNPRVVGGVTPACTAAAALFYGRAVLGTVHTTSAETAELAKLAENAFRDVNIAYANELANVCDRLGTDVDDVIALANHHPRVQILKPGPGVGGHCIAVDPWFIAASAPQDTPLIRAARAVNDGRPVRVVAEVRRRCAELERPTVACLGLSYKPDIDDLRQSPALAIAGALRDAAQVLVVEPHLEQSPLDELVLVDADAALSIADIVVILVAHKAFEPLIPRLRSHSRVIDTVGLMRAPTPLRLVAT